MPESTDQRIRLRDGRSLSYAEYGALGGRPAFFFHGTPGSRLLRHPDDDIAVALNIRLIVPDRPGMGLSDFKPGRTLLDWPDDVLELADALHLERFAVVGFSGGGPYAAACAFKLPQRLTTASLVSGIGPLDAPGALKGMIASNRLGYAVGRWMPWPLWRILFRVYYGAIRRHPERLARMDPGEPQADHVVFARPGVREIFVQAFAEAFRQGTAGVARDAWLLSRPWGFNLDRITVPVYLWQGEADTIVTPAMARAMADRIPASHATFLPGEGHLVYIQHWEAILRQSG